MKKGIKPLAIRYDEKGHRRMIFEPEEFEKYIQDNPGTNAPVVNDAGEIIGVLPTDAIQKCLLECQLTEQKKV